MESGCSISRRGDGRALWVFDDLVEIKVTGEDTADAYSVLEDWPAPTYAPLQHVHVGQDEIVHIIEGSFVLASGLEERELEAGDIVRIPRGTAHAFRNVGQAAGHRLVTFVPAGPEKLWAEIGTPATDRSSPPAEGVDARRFRDAAKRHGLEIVTRRQPPGAR